MKFITYNIKEILFCTSLSYSIFIRKSMKKLQFLLKIVIFSDLLCDLLDFLEQPYTLHKAFFDFKLLLTLMSRFLMEV